MHTHENVLANVETAFRVCGIPAGMGADLRTLVVVPLFHVTGCHSQALVALRGGGAVVIDSAFDGARMIDTLDHERISACTAVPAIYYFILNHPSFAPSRMSAVRWVSYGGAPIAPALVERIAENFPSSRVGNGFGLTEATSIATFLPHEWAAEHADSVGFAAPHTEVAIADADPVTGTGEILIRGQSVCAGYWKKPDATAATFVDSWLHTGDAGRIDGGLVHVLDRLKDMINRGGENVYSVEVENGGVGGSGGGGRARAGAPGRLQGAAVHRGAFGAAAAEPERQDSQVGAAGQRLRHAAVLTVYRRLAPGWYARWPSILAVAGQGTPATKLLAKLGVAHTVHSYPHDPRHGSFGIEAAEAMGVTPCRVFKTLIAEVDGKLTAAMVPVDRQLDLKALAAAVGGKRARMAEVAAAERATGYVAGGISPLGQRQRIPLVIDESAADQPTVYCSAGRRGLEIELAPADLIAAAAATVAPIAA
jgi:Cys-tRNA(Pro) deacylase